MPGSHTVESLTRFCADVTNGRPPGTALEQAFKHRAGRLRIWRTCGCRAGAFTERRRDTRTSTSLDVARCRGPRSIRTLASPAPSVSSEEHGKMNAGDPGA